MGAGPRIEVDGGQPRSKKKEELNTVIGELNEMVGLEEAKKQLNSFISFAQVMMERRRRKLPKAGINMHMVFAGPPGTGKTVVARKVGRMLRAIGLLTEGHCIEVDRSHLVAPYVGQTAAKTRDLVMTALDGVLFIDEAYTLTAQETQHDPFGQEAVDTLLTMMENHRERLVVIVAGYTKRMKDFVDSNPGLRSRFSRTVEFQSYSPKDLMRIFEAIVAEHEMRLTEGAAQEAERCINDMANRHAAEQFGNARAVRGFFEEIVTAQAERLCENLQGLEIEKLQCIEEVDIQRAAGLEV